MSGDLPVFVVVVNFNGWRDTIECLESVLRGDYPEVRVIVCDNASTNDSVDRIVAWANGLQPAAQSAGSLAPLTTPAVAKPVPITVRAANQYAPVTTRLTLIRLAQNLGFAGGNNEGIRLALATGDGYVLLFNNDAIMAPGAIRAMVDVARQDTTTGAVGATILQYHSPERVETLGGATIGRRTGLVHAIAENTSRQSPRPASVRLDYVIGCCLLAPLGVARTVGMMAEHYFLYGEDADWCLRMSQAGYTMRYAPGAEVWHKGGGSVVHRSVMHDYYAVRGTLMLMHEHFRGAMPIVLAHGVARFLLPKVVRGQWRRLVAAARGFRDYFRYAAGRPVPRAIS
jgi:GT2 family glycosyltransferase